VAPDQGSVTGPRETGRRAWLRAIKKPNPFHAHPRGGHRLLAALPPGAFVKPWKKKSQPDPVYFRGIESLPNISTCGLFWGSRQQSARDSNGFFYPTAAFFSSPSLSLCQTPHRSLVLLRRARAPGHFAVGRGSRRSPRPFSKIAGRRAPPEEKELYWLFGKAPGIPEKFCHHAWVSRASLRVLSSSGKGRFFPVCFRRYRPPLIPLTQPAGLTDAKFF